MKQYIMYYYSDFSGSWQQYTRNLYATDYDDAKAQAEHWLSTPLKGESKNELIAVTLL